MQSILETIFGRLPVVFLGVALLLSFFYDVHAGNHDLAGNIVAGFLGYLTGRAVQPAPKVNSPTTTNINSTTTSEDPQP